MKRALFPGKFDPLHNGHVEVCLRATELFDEVIFAVSDFRIYRSVFPLQERIDMACETFVQYPKVRVVGYKVLTVEIAHSLEVQVIISGLGVFSDFEREFKLALTRHRLAPDLEVIALLPSEKSNFLTSSMVRQIAARGGNMESMVPAPVAQALRQHKWDW